VTELGEPAETAVLCWECSAVSPRENYKKVAPAETPPKLSPCAAPFYQLQLAAYHSSVLYVNASEQQLHMLTSTVF